MTEQVRQYLIAAVQSDIDATHDDQSDLNATEIAEYKQLWSEAGQALNFDFSETITDAERRHGPLSN